MAGIKELAKSVGLEKDIKGTNPLSSLIILIKRRKKMRDMGKGERKGRIPKELLEAIAKRKK